MKYITFLLGLIFLAVSCQCGSPQKKGPPWENLPKQERSTHIEKYGCPEATAFVGLLSSSNWLVVSPEEVVEEPPGLFIEVLASKEGQVVARLYSKNKEGEAVNIMLFVSPDNSIIVDYEVFVRVAPTLRRLQAGEISEEAADAILFDAYGKSTGKYFCYLFRDSEPVYLD